MIKHREGSNGFSMIEVIVAIAIVSLMAVVAVPNFRPFIDRLRLRTATNTIKQQLLLAKTRALGDPIVHCGVYFNTTPNPNQTLAFLDDGAGANANNDRYDAGSDHVFVVVYTLPKNITMTIPVAGGHNNVIMFRGDGSAKVRSLTITLKIGNDSAKSKTITVLASTGRIRVQ
jgi:prepilin-type N-terminal cleavage/methylation domain-containing protein